MVKCQSYHEPSGTTGRVGSMESSYLAALGEAIPFTDLCLEQAQEMVSAIEANPYVTLIECRRGSAGGEVLVFDTNVELSQARKADIRRTERLAIEFYPNEERPLPDVLALREDFPSVPHLNLRERTYPKSLCIFEEPPEEVKLHWSAPQVLERIRRWLALTARGDLHGADQPLEPLLSPSLTQLVVPHDIFFAGGEDEILVVAQGFKGSNGIDTLIAKRIPNVAALGSNGEYVTMLVRTDPQVHGVIAATPMNLSELAHYLHGCGIDLLTTLRTRLKIWRSELPAIIHSKLILVVSLPKQRVSGVTPDAWDVRAFLTNDTIRTIGIEIGIWENVGEVEGRLGDLVFPNEKKMGEQVPLALLNLQLSYSRLAALRLSGLELAPESKLALVGVGALGSQVFMNLARMGYGRWTVVDNDIFLPHNLSRHALTAPFVGWEKASAVSLVANQMLGDPQFATPIVENLMNSASSKDLVNALQDADIIIDASTSIPVARHLVHEVESSARRVSIFLNPSATDLVLLAEDESRQIPLDIVEMQYYRHLLHHPRLREHLKLNEGRIRYSGSCRDISTQIPQDLIALHAGTTSRALRKVISLEEAAIWIWQSDTNGFGLAFHCLEVAPIYRRKLGEWTLCWDQTLLDKLNVARTEKLPNETGGILIGSYDMQRKIMYLVDTILSPPDSQEWPTLYIRGYHGLSEQLDRISEITAHRLTYVGEWHSHPNHTGCKPSADDKRAFEWLREKMMIDGLPPLMMIVGDSGQYEWYLGQMGRDCK